MKVETAFETAQHVVTISMGCARMKMVLKHVNFPFPVNDLGLNISTDKPKTDGEL